MTKIFTTLSAGLLMTGLSQALVVDLELAALGNYTNASATVVTTTVVIGTTGSFDISYTVGSMANGANPFVRSTGSQYGVGSDTDITQHYATLEGNDGEGISFTSLSMDNFVEGDSGYVIGDFADLTLKSISFNNVANNQDGVNISFTSFGDAGAANQNLNATSTGGTPYTLDLTALANFSEPETSVFLENDNTASSNRWAIEGIEIFYNIPEPSSSAILLGGLGMLTLLRRRN